MFRNRKIILYLICFILLCICVGLYIVVDPFYEEVVVTNHLIGEREVVCAEDLELLKVPKRMINGDYYLSSDEVTGLVTKINMAIPKGSFLYKNALETNIRDDIDLKLKDNEVSYDLFVRDIKANSGHLNEGMYVDLYLTLNKDKAVSDLLVSSCKIIALYNAQNERIRDYETANATIITINLLKDQVAYVNKALISGEISLVVGNDPYSERQSSLNKESEVLAYIE